MKYFFFSPCLVSFFPALSSIAAIMNIIKASLNEMRRKVELLEIKVFLNLQLQKSESRFCFLWKALKELVDIQ